MSASDAQIAKRLHRAPPLDAHDLSIAMRTVRRISMEDIELANSIVPNAGDYLSRSYIDSLIRADVSDGDAKREMKRERDLFERLRWLLPDLLGFFKFDDFMTELTLLHRIDDSFHDFPIYLSSKRSDRERRDAPKDLSNAISRLRGARTALDKINYTSRFEFETIHRLYYKYIRDRSQSQYSFSDLMLDIKLCSDTMELCLHMAELDDEYIPITGNQARSALVGCVYEICLSYRGPNLVTTPNSEFSSLCSLLYEVVSGQRDQSLAGAINRYARSPDRTKADGHYAEWLREEEIAKKRDTDNFYHSRESANHFLEESNRWHSLSKSPDITDQMRFLIGLQMLEALEKAKEVSENYGPHLVWADQRSPKYYSDLRSKTDELEAKIRKANFELGQQRRGKPHLT